MPPLIAVILLGAGAYAGIRAARHLWERSVGEHRDARGRLHPDARSAAPAGEKDLGVLEYDAAAGVYRPARRE